MRKISICIPAYKKPANLERLLRSVQLQVFQDYEIIITDDSPDESVKEVLKKFTSLPITYYYNQPALGTPSNWNFGISLAKGEWIKIMHDDDWFADEHSLLKFAEKTNTDNKVIFSRYYNVFASGEVKQPAFPPSWKQKIIDEPLLLIADNVIGPPSVSLLHNSIKEQYDPRMKWRVDQDFYIRLINRYKNFLLIEEPLVKVGISDTQVTNDCINEPEVELPEGLLLLEKYGTAPLKNILVYDAWWRILRNVEIRDKSQIEGFTPGKKWPDIIYRMIKHQSSIPQSLLKNGFISKPAMTLSFIRNQKFLDSNANMTNR